MRGAGVFRWVGVLGLLGILLSGCKSRLPAPKPKSVNVLVVVIDQSASTQVANRCAELAARLEGYLPRVHRLDLAVFASGDTATSGGEPVVLVPWRRHADDAKLYEQPGRALARRKAWIEEVEALCRISLRPTSSSPLYQALYRAQASIAAHCADMQGIGERCERRMVFAHTDLIENADVAIAQRLSDVGRALRRGRRPGRRPAALPLLKAEVEWSICGISNHVAARHEEALPPGTVEMVWREILADQTISFDATCPLRGEMSSSPVGNVRSAP